MLSLSNYDIGMLSSWKIYGARLASCSAGAVHLLPGKLEVLHRPKLERLCWDGWICPNAPLSLGVVSSITELRLICIAVPGFKPSNVLRGSTAIQDLTLSFQREPLVATREEATTSWHIHQVWHVKEDDSLSGAIRWYHNTWCACLSTVALITVSNKPMAKEKEKQMRLTFGFAKCDSRVLHYQA